MSKPDALTVTLNPAIDQTITVEHLRVGSVQRAEKVLYNAGGKGVNVAACLADWGVNVAATGILGGGNASPFDLLFASKGIADHFLRQPGDVRTNIKIADRTSSETTDINLPGLCVDQQTLDWLEEKMLPLISPGLPVVLGGSLPQGLGDDTYADLCAGLALAKAKVFLDTSGGPLTQALKAPRGQLPYCLKPNRHELEAWAGQALSTEADLLAAARRMLELGIALVVVSMGGDGALFVNAQQAVKARLPEIQAISSVGAGDAMVAGLVAATLENRDLAGTARLAVSFARAKLEKVGPHLPDRAALLKFSESVELSVLAQP